MNEERQSLPILDEWKSSTHKLKTTCGTLYLTINYADEERKTISGLIPYMENAGECSSAISALIMTMVETFTGHTISWREVAIRLMRISCNKEAVSNPCCVKAIGTQMLKIADD